MAHPDNPKTGWSLIDEDEYPNGFGGIEESDLTVLDWVHGANGWAIALPPGQPCTTQDHVLSTQDAKPQAGTPVSKGKGIAPSVTVEDVVQTVYDLFVASCSCPICHDILYAFPVSLYMNADKYSRANPYLLATCGHTMCGACLCDWVDKTSWDPRCPVCRGYVRVLPCRNYAMESVIDQQVKILMAHAYPGWELRGVGVLEWMERRRDFQSKASACLARVAEVVLSNNGQFPSGNPPGDQDQVIQIQPSDISTGSGVQ